MQYKILKISVGLMVLLVIAVMLISISHPILLKWFADTARNIGKPINATVYTNGRVNHDIKVYRVDNAYWDNEKTNDYLLNLKAADGEEMLDLLNIDLKKRWIGQPAGIGKSDYDFINGYLFQSETGSHFQDLADDIKGYNLNPQLSFTDKYIKFNFPPNALKFDSIRIELEKQLVRKKGLK